MFGIRYTYVRPILAVFTLLILAWAIFFAHSTAVVVGLIVLSVVTFLSWINPPGVYGWLMQGACPHCHGHVVWEIQQVPEPYYEIISVRCEDCGRNKIEFAFQPH